MAAILALALLVPQVGAAMAVIFATALLCVHSPACAHSSISEGYF